LPAIGKERAFLGLGGNFAETRVAMAQAIRMIDADRLTRVTAVSSLYSTPPWGVVDQASFLNSVIEVSTSRSPRALLQLCLDTEATLKRVRGERFGPRLIDVDVLLYGDRTVKEMGLEVPHPRMFIRAFVLAPLEEIAPDLTLRNVRVASHLKGLDTSGIEKVEAGPNWWKA
jgi:2-amino-4-hydroxy-6-hydroxymethyldihydropteridine diphosphokinase